LVKPDDYLTGGDARMKLRLKQRTAEYRISKRRNSTGGFALRILFLSKKQHTFFRNLSLFGGFGLRYSFKSFSFDQPDFCPLPAAAQPSGEDGSSVFCHQSSVICLLSSVLCLLSSVFCLLPSVISPPSS